MASYVDRARNIYVVEYPQEGNVAHLKHQLERLEISGYRLKTAGLHLEYESPLETLRIFVTPVQELGRNRSYQRAEFKLLRSTTSSSSSAIEIENALNGIVDELNSKLEGIQLESLAEFAVREKSIKGELKNFTAMLRDFFSSRLFWAVLVSSVALLMVLVLTVD